MQCIKIYKKISPAPDESGIGLRVQTKGIEVPRVLGLRADLCVLRSLRGGGRHGEREPVATRPPDARPAVVCAEPATSAVTARAQQARIAFGVVDGLVHGNDRPQTHCFDLLVRELLADEACEFGVGLYELAYECIHPNAPRGPIVVLKEHTLENGHLGGHAAGRREVWALEHPLGVVIHPKALESGDPLLAGRAVRSDGEVDDAVFLAPRVGWFAHHNLAAEKTERHVVATELLDDGVELAGSEAG